MLIAMANWQNSLIILVFLCNVFFVYGFYLPGLAPVIYCKPGDVSETCKVNLSGAHCLGLLWELELTVCYSVFKLSFIAYYSFMNTLLSDKSRQGINKNITFVFSFFSFELLVEILCRTTRGGIGFNTGAGLSTP